MRTECHFADMQRRIHNFSVKFKMPLRTLYRKNIVRYAEKYSEERRLSKRKTKQMQIKTALYWKASRNDIMFLEHNSFDKVFPFVQGVTR